jgi:hypothetical protein
MVTLYVGERFNGDTLCRRKVNGDTLCTRKVKGDTLHVREGSTNIPMCFIKIYKESLPR